LNIMRAMVLEKPKPAEEGPLRLVELAEPKPGAGQIRVRVRACGVCHTDLHTVEGELTLPKLPLVPGHQIVGLVDALGAGVKNFREGDRVGIPWLHWACGECFYCQAGQENLCDRARFTGLHVDGGYAEATIVSESFAMNLPDGFSDFEAAPLLCAGIIGYRALCLANIHSGERLGLYGFGASAHIVLQLARHMQCEVYVFTRGEAHRQLALRLGAAWAGSAQDQPPTQIDGAIIFAPAGALALDALRETRKGGTVALAGITMSVIPAIDYSKLLYHERVLRSVANSTREDARELLRLAAEIPVRTEVEVFELDQANRALLAMKQSKIRGAAVLKIASAAC
jgi:alcohol dehydrogenase, propanol-preferring